MATTEGWSQWRKMEICLFSISLKSLSVKYRVYTFYSQWSSKALNQKACSSASGTMVIGRNLRRWHPSGMKLGHFSHDLKRSISHCLCFLDAPRWAVFSAICSHHNTPCDYDFTATWSSDHRLRSLNPWLKIKFPSLGVNCFRYFCHINRKSTHSENVSIVYFWVWLWDYWSPSCHCVSRELLKCGQNLLALTNKHYTHSTSVCSPDLQAQKY